MKKAATAIMFFMCLQVYVHAQGENNIWTFGDGAGLDFNPGNPLFTTSSMYAKEGCASISDAFGNLIFYTSGSSVWDKNGNQMPNGNILGNAYGGSGTQAALILKSLSNPHQYYVFTLDPQEIAVNFNPKLRYSIVDMTLNNGMGDIDPATDNIVLNDEMEERMVAVESSDCGYWIVGHKRHSNQYVSYKLTANGIQPPVYSSGAVTGNFNGSDIGEMKISPDKSRIALMFYNSSVIEVGTFNSTTGLVSNVGLLDSTANGYPGYGLSFSPDNSKLYATMNQDSVLNQYDMMLYPNFQGMKDNKLKIAVSSNPMSLWGMRIGADQKIYISNFTSGYISRINNPNNSGLSCNYEDQSVQVPSSAFFNNAAEPFYGYGFGNPTVALTYKDTLPGRYVDTLVCFADSAILRVADNLLNYTWNDGVTGISRYVHQDGIYYCLSTKECRMRMDTFKVTFVKGNLTLGPDTTICPGDSMVLQVSGNGFQWQDGSTNPTFTVRQSGIYSVRINEKGCYYADTIQVSLYTPAAVIEENDQLLCEGEVLVLHGHSVPEGILSWSDGTAGDRITVNTTGHYRLTAENVCGYFYDSVWVQVQDCNCQPGVPNAFTPNGDGLNDNFKVLLNCFTKNYMLSIYNRYGQRIFSVADQDRGWDGYFNGKALDAGTYFYYLRYETPNGQDIQRKGDITLIR